MQTKNKGNEKNTVFVPALFPKLRNGIRNHLICSIIYKVVVKFAKFFCKTDFDMKEIKREEAGYVPLPKFYTFKSRDERERILYKNFVQVGQDVKEMIKDVLNKRGAK